MIVGSLREQKMTFPRAWRRDHNPAFALGWLVLVLSVGAVSLLNWLIRQSSAVNVASLFYLVPPCTALVAWALFGESFSYLALWGMAMVVGGVYMARQ